MFGRTRISNMQRETGTSIGIGVLYRSLCALILSPVRLLRLIRGWVGMEEIETYRMKDQGGHQKSLVYQRKHRCIVARSREDSYEDVIRIESPPKPHTMMPASVPQLRSSRLLGS
jgi:hypothetical protein